MPGRRSTPQPEPLERVQAAIFAIPARGVRGVLSSLKSIVTNRFPLIISATGMDQGTGLFMNEVVGDVLPGAEPLSLTCSSRQSRRHHIGLPIVDAVHAIVDEGSPPEEELARLLARPLGAEIRQG